MDHCIYAFTHICYQCFNLDDSYGTVKKGKHRLTFTLIASKLCILGAPASDPLFAQTCARCCSPTKTLLSFFLHISCFLFFCVNIHIGVKRDKYEKRSPTKTWLKSRIWLDLQIPLKSDGENNDEDEGNAVDDDNDYRSPSILSEMAFAEGEKKLRYRGEKTRRTAPHWKSRLFANQKDHCCF